ncbi:hypothetical protein D3C72_2013230 [compost metagenome]
MSDGELLPDIRATAASVCRTSAAVAPFTTKATFECLELPSCGFAEVTSDFQPASVSTTTVLR